MTAQKNLLLECLLICLHRSKGITFKDKSQINFFFYYLTANMVQRREKLVFNSGGPILYLLSLEYIKLKSLAVPAQNATGPCGVYLTYPHYIFSWNSIVFSFNYWCNFQSNLNNSLPLFKNDVVRTLALPFLITYLTYLKTASA